MSEPNPPRRPLATFLRAASPDASKDVRAVSGDITATPVVPDAAPAAPVGQGTVGTGTNAFEEPAEAHREPLEEGPDARDAASSDLGAAPVSPLYAHRPPTPAAEPVFLRAPAAPAPVPRWQWGVIATLIALLLLQIAVADRQRLAADASTRPWIAGLCSVLRCTLPAWHEPAAYAMISREIRPVPGQAGTLQVQAAIRNDARWAQDWPSLRLTLSDADGRVIGSGVFSPRQYLPAGMHETAQLAPGQSAQLAFQVREPAASTVAFTFDFL